MSSLLLHLTTRVGMPRPCSGEESTAVIACTMLNNDLAGPFRKTREYIYNMLVGVDTGRVYETTVDSELDLACQLIVELRGSLLG